MKQLIIGVDPDSKAHGVAVYAGGTLMDLHTMTLMELQQYIVEHKGSEFRFSIENVCANNFVYSRNTTRNSVVNSNIAKKVGACQQAQTELQRMLDHMGITYELHKPQSGNWAKNKKRFEQVTGWSGRSNEDTRSAAYFGFLAARKKAA